MRNQAFGPHGFINEVAALSRADRNIPDPETGVGRECYAFSAEEDRVFRFAENEIRGVLRNHTEANDYSLEHDAVGNLFVTFFGLDRTLLPFMMHSHLDSVENGGKYDGVAGVASAIGVLNDIALSGQKPQRSFRVGIYRSEESSPRNGAGCLGSAIATATISPERLRTIEHQPGRKLEAIFQPRQWQQMLSEAKTGTITAKNTAASLELHVEQSALIAENGCDIGIVVGGIGGACRQRVAHRLVPHIRQNGGECLQTISLEVLGVADHTGGTPPNPWFFRAACLYRKDALVASGYILNRLLRNDFVELLRSVSLVDSGYTSMPSRQLSELVTTESRVAAVLRKAVVLAGKAKRRFGVEVRIKSCRYPGRRVETVAPATVRRYLNLPLIVSSLATKAFWREDLAFGTTRATVTDYHLTPRELKFKLDLREVNGNDLQRLKNSITGRVKNTLGSDALVAVSEKRSQPIDASLAERLRSLAQKLGISYVGMPSLPGHDSDRHAQAGIPVAMLFIRQNDGISHSPFERMEKAHFDAADRLAKEFAKEMLSQ